MRRLRTREIIGLTTAGALIALGATGCAGMSQGGPDTARSSSTIAPPSDLYVGLKAREQAIYDVYKSHGRDTRRKITGDKSLLSTQYLLTGQFTPKAFGDFGIAATTYSDSHMNGYDVDGDLLATLSPTNFGVGADYNPTTGKSYDSGEFHTLKGKQAEDVEVSGNAVTITDAKHPRSTTIHDHAAAIAILTIIMDDSDGYFHAVEQADGVAGISRPEVLTSITNPQVEFDAIATLAVQPV